MGKTRPAPLGLATTRVERLRNTGVMGIHCKSESKPEGDCEPHSPREIVFFPEFETELGLQRSPEVWHRFDYSLLSSAEIRDLLELYALAQEAAIPIIHDKWSEKQRREREQDRKPHEDRPSAQIMLFPTLE